MANIQYLPDSLYPSSMDVNVVFNNVVHTSPYNGEEQFEERPGARWVFKFAYADLEQDEARDLQGFLLSLRGVIGQFYAKDYAFFDKRGSISGKPTVTGNSNAGCRCAISGAPRNSDIFYRGDYVKISGRLHMMSENIRSDSQGNATLVFSPPMRTVPTDGTAVEYDNFTVTCRLKDDKQAKRSSKDMSNSFSFEAIEVL